jgi:hypothetical protein
MVSAAGTASKGVPGEPAVADAAVVRRSLSLHTGGIHDRPATTVGRVILA